MSETHRVNVSLPAEYGARLKAMAERMHMNEGTLARTLLAQAIDDAGPDPDELVRILNGIPGFWHNIDASLAQARRGNTMSLDEFRESFDA